MSLSWRKRQAIASDQKTWRGLGVDSALWTSIDRNATNVKTSLGNSGSTGVVTSVKFVKTEGLNLENTPAGTDMGTSWVSDVSNAAVEASSENWLDTLHPTSTAGNGLAIHIKRFGTEAFKTQAVPYDVSGIKYNIVNGGSGYKVGDTFTILQGVKQVGKQVTIDDANSGPATNLTVGNSVQQEAYKITEIDCTPGPNLAGVPVVLSLSSGGSANGFLVANTNPGGTTSTSIQVISTLDQPFDSTLGTGLTVNGAAISPFSTGVETSRKAAVNGFLMSSTAGGAVTSPSFYQTLAQFQAGKFEKAFSKFVTGGSTVITATEAGNATSPFTTTDEDFVGAVFNNDGPTNVNLQGRLSVEITSVTNTSPEAGRN